MDDDRSNWQVKTNNTAEPQPTLSLFDAVALIVGIVVGAGIFRTPSLVAGNAGSAESFIFAWILGGVVSLIGALCYAELTTAFPSTGGDYHFLSRAFGKRIAFLFAWSRMSVIQTGSVALLSFIFGDYLSQLYNIGEYSSVIYASFVIIILTVINIIGLKLGTGVQKILTIIEVSGVLLVIIAGFFFAPTASVVKPEIMQTAASSFGLTMVFVLLTFGGWSEAAYISAELRTGKSGKKRMAKALILSIIIITFLYLIINLSYLKVLGLDGVAGSTAVAGDLMELAFGNFGLWLIGLMIAISALTSANATIFTGARTNYALGRDFLLFAPLGKWNTKAAAPVNAFIWQGVISLALILLGLLTRKGFETIVEYTAPVFWFFFFLVGISLFVLRHKEPDIERPFRVPFYPITPILFCLTCVYLFYSSLAYTGWGAFIGVAVLLIGVIILLVLPKLESFLKSKQLRRSEDEISAV